MEIFYEGSSEFVTHEYKDLWEFAVTHDLDPGTPFNVTVVFNLYGGGQTTVWSKIFQCEFHCCISSKELENKE